ncbi:hypothetical protein ACWODU_03835, partial [Enterococcus durans]
LNPPMNLLAKLILKDFRVSFLYFFIQKKMLAKFTNIKKYRAKIKKDDIPPFRAGKSIHTFSCSFLLLKVLFYQSIGKKRFSSNNRIMDNFSVGIL